MRVPPVYSSPHIADNQQDSLRVDPAVIARFLNAPRQVAAQPWLYTEIAQRMSQRLDLIRTQPTAVMTWWDLLGGGDDILTKRYAKASRWDVEPTAVWRDAVTQAHRRPWWSFKHGPQWAVALESEASVWSGQADALWANMVIPWVDDVPAVMQRWHQALRPEGFLMFSGLGPDTLQELRALYQKMGWPPPMAAYPDMHDLGDMLMGAGFAEPIVDVERWTLTWPDPLAMLRELRSWGRNLSPERFAGWRTPRWHQQLVRAVAQEACGEGGRVTMTIEVVYGHAFRGVQRQASGETRIDLTALQAQLPSRRRFVEK